MAHIITYVKTHRVLSGLGVIVVIGTSYFAYKAIAGTKVTTQYVLTEAQKGTLITSISGSGQVSVTNQVDVKAKVSGDVLGVVIVNGQEVKLGDTMATVNARDALKAVRDAVDALNTAQLSLDKIKQGSDQLTLLQSENSLQGAYDNLEKLKLSQVTNYQKAEDAKKKAENAIVKAYEDAFNALASTFLNLPDINTDLYTILYSDDIAKSEKNLATGSGNVGALMNNITNGLDQDKLKLFKDSALSDYVAASSRYESNFEQYKNTDRYATHETIEVLLNKTIETTRYMAQAAKSESNFLDAWVDYRSKANQSIFTKVKEYQTSLSQYISQTNSSLSSLLSVQTALADNKQTVITTTNDLHTMDQNNPRDLKASEATVAEREASLLKLKAGADVLDIRSSELNLRQRQNALLDAREKLADYTIRAPFDGTIAKVSAKKGDSISSGTAIATLISKQKLAEISLNEVDVSKLKLGQKVNLSFDAIEGLTLTGVVTDIDSLGTVSQGVVTYSVKISFDTEDARVKPGMSVSASIITDIRQDAILVPNAAIKNSANGSYVEMPDEEVVVSTGVTGITLKKAPRRQVVEVGLSNDTSREIVSGLTEGEKIITRTIESSAKPAATQGTSLFPTGGGGRGLGGVGGGARPAGGNVAR